MYNFFKGIVVKGKCKWNPQIDKNESDRENNTYTFFFLFFCLEMLWILESWFLPLIMLASFFKKNVYINVFKQKKNRRPIQKKNGEDISKVLFSHKRKKMNNLNKRKKRNAEIRKIIFSPRSKNWDKNIKIRNFVESTARRFAEFCKIRRRMARIEQIGKTMVEKNHRCGPSGKEVFSIDKSLFPHFHYYLLAYFKS